MNERVEAVRAWLETRGPALRKEIEGFLRSTEGLKPAAAKAAVAEIEKELPQWRTGPRASFWRIPVKEWLAPRRQALIEWMNSQPAPSPLARFAEAIEWPANADLALLEAELAANFSQWPGKRWWTKTAEQHLRQTAHDILRARFLTKPELFKRWKEQAYGLPRPVMLAVYDQMRASGELREIGKWVGSVQHPEGYLELLRSDFTARLEQARAAGVGESSISTFLQSLGSGSTAASPAPTAGYDSQILAALETMQQSRGAPVSIPLLRARAEFAGVPKTDFDQSAIKLYRDRQVYLGEHSDPHSLPARERDELVHDGTGRYYVAIAARD